MQKRILITYASVSGSTADVAEAIGEVVAASGVDVDVLPMRQVGSLESYSAVVLGSSIRVGRWLPEAVSFLEAHRQPLSSRIVAYFTTCLTMADGTDEAQRTTLAYMTPILELAPEVKPVSLGLFAGSFDPDRRLILPPGAGPHGDYRDWAAIRAWAEEIRPVLAAAPARPDLTEIGLAAGQDLREVDLSDAELQQAGLEGAALHWARLEGSDLSRASLQNANLMGTNLQGATLRGANLERAVLNGAILSQADLQQASLVNADLNWVDFTAADLRQADLSGSALGWADFTGARLEGAVFTQARYNYYTIWPEDFSPEAAGCILVEMPG